MGGPFSCGPPASGRRRGGPRRRHRSVLRASTEPKPGPTSTARLAGQHGSAAGVGPFTNGSYGLVRVRGGRLRRWSGPSPVHSRRSVGWWAASSGWRTLRRSRTRSCWVPARPSGCRRSCSGFLVVRRCPANRVGALLDCRRRGALSIFGREVYSAAADRVPGLPDSMVLVALEQGVWMWWYVPVALLVLFFPDGRLPGPRWRWVAAGLVVVAVAFISSSPATPRRSRRRSRPRRTRCSPGRRSGPALTVAALALLPVFLGLLVATAGRGRALRRARPGAAGAAAWLALGALFLPATLLLCWASYLLFGGADLVLVGLALTYVGLPAAVAVAILRHDLYDIDRRCRATATYGLVTGAARWSSDSGGHVRGRAARRATRPPSP